MIKLETVTAESKIIQILDLLRFALLVTFLSLFFVTFIGQKNTVVGSSMYPTLHDGEGIFVEKFTKYFHKIPRGAIVTLETTSFPYYDGKATRLIKRVIGQPGDTIEIGEGAVYVNGKLLEEPYLGPEVVTMPHNPAYAKVTLGPWEYYCMGDNRSNSKDCRDLGPVKIRSIIGHLKWRIYPFDKFGNPDTYMKQERAKEDVPKS